MRRQDKLLVIENVEIYNYYKERLINVALSQFSYQNLPETCDRMYFERVLLMNGSAAFYKPKDTDFIVSTGYVYDASGQNGGFDLYGYPTKIRGMGYNATNIETDDFVILFDNMTKTSLMNKIDLYARLLWECHMTFRQNLAAQRTPYLIACNKNEALSYENIINRINGFDPVLKLKDCTSIEDNIKVLDLRKEYIGNELLDSLKTIWNEAMRMLGITGETTKRERLLDGELQMNRMQDTITMSSRLLNRVEFCNKVNKRWGLDVSINLVSADTEFLPYVDPYFDMDGDSSNSETTVKKDKEDENDG